MPALAIDHYNIRAPRLLLDALRDFYCQRVGLVVGERPPFRSFGYWLYANGHDVLHLTEAQPGESRSTSVVPTFDHVAFVCEDYDAMLEGVRQDGIEYAIDDVPLTGQRQIFFRDPAGNGVELNFSPAQTHDMDRHR